MGLVQGSLLLNSELVHSTTTRIKDKGVGAQIISPHNCQEMALYRLIPPGYQCMTAVIKAVSRSDRLYGRKTVRKSGDGPVELASPLLHNVLLHYQFSFLSCK